MAHLLSLGLAGWLFAKTRENVRTDGLEIKQSGIGNATLFACLRISAKPLRYSLRAALAQLGNLNGSTEIGNDFFVVHAPLKHA